MIRSIGRRPVAALAVAALLVGGLASAGSAEAKSKKPKPPASTSFEIDYDASGSSHIATPNATVTLSKVVSRTFISNSGDGTFTGDLPLAPTTASFNALGLLPVRATVTFVPAGTLSGSISQDVPVRLTATATYYLKLSNVTALGLPLSVGDSCQTAAPVTIPVATPAGQSFDLTDGGALTGTYTIGKFANCGLLNTGLINLLVPGSGNTVNFQLSNGRFVS